jgi:hypothetical protein
MASPVCADVSFQYAGLSLFGPSRLERRSKRLQGAVPEGLAVAEAEGQRVGQDDAVATDQAHLQAASPYRYSMRLTTRKGRPTTKHCMMKRGGRYVHVVCVPQRVVQHVNLSHLSRNFSATTPLPIPCLPRDRMPLQGVWVDFQDGNRLRSRYVSMGHDADGQC